MKLAIVRPGALGDVLMLGNLIPALKKEHEVTLFSDPSIHSVLNSFMNRVVNFRPTTEHKEANFDRTIYPWGYPASECGPGKKMAKHILAHFAEELGVPLTFDDFRLVQQFATEYKPYITIQVKAGWSAYKEWDKWDLLVMALRPYIDVFQIGGPNDPPITGVKKNFCGKPFDLNMYVQSWATGHIGIDSVFNHTTNIIWDIQGRVPSVILFGSTQADAFGYPTNTNVSLNLPCQPCFRQDPAMTANHHGPCINPPGQIYSNPQHSCMKDISIDMVYEIAKHKFKL